AAAGVHLQRVPEVRGERLRAVLAAERPEVVLARRPGGRAGRVEQVFGLERPLLVLVVAGGLFRERLLVARGAAGDGEQHAAAVHALAVLVRRDRRPRRLRRLVPAERDEIPHDRIPFGPAGVGVG